MHEASLHDANSFITLTYSPEHLPTSGSLNKDHFQRFIKRLRKKLSPDKIRFYHCGEYGENLNRPHYHAIIFGFDFPDRYLWSFKNNIRLYRSDLLEKLWPYGYSTIGEVTFESAAYVARYIMKKQLGKGAEDFYADKLPPYTTMSRRPGIAGDWIKQFKNDVYPDDAIVIRNNITCKPPRFYDNLYDIENTEQFKEVKTARLKAQNSPKAKQDNTPQRLEAKQKCKQSKLTELKREIHDDH
jgi:hypothetical protein